MRTHRLLAGLLLLAAAGLAGSCRREEPAAAEPRPTVSETREGPPHARWDLVDELRRGQEVVFHPSDGGGRARLEEAVPEVPVASHPGRFTLLYEVGPEGIATGGVIFLQVSPFWGWSTPQVERSDAPGFTELSSDIPGARFEAETVDQQLLAIHNLGPALVAGQKLRIVYGAGSIGAVVDRFAESRSRFWFAVDGDGDGIRKVLPDSPTIRVRAGPPARLEAILPSVARPGETLRLVLAVLDRAGNSGTDFVGELEIAGAEPVLELPERVRFEASDRGVLQLEGRVREAGSVRLQVSGPDGLAAESNPLVASPQGPRILWGDLHGHSALSDGTGTPEGYFRYARDVAALDVVALTDHDHWGMLTLDDHPELWDEIRASVARFHQPGRFVTLLGYEWTNWIYGHRHVLYFADEGRVYSSMDPATETPQQLWKALEGQPALTFAHHSGGGPVPTDWTIPPDPVLEPVTEIVSVHGSSEAMDSPGLIYDAIPDNQVRGAALGRGYRLGFIGSGDSHDGHPGFPQLAGASGGLAAILADKLDRPSVLQALRNRRVYATNGPRILLRMALGSHPMGSVVSLPEGGTLSDELYVNVVGTAPLARVELVRSGQLDGVDAEGRLEVRFYRRLEDLRAGEYVYVRAVQQDGGVAWSSPIYLE